MPKAVPMDTVQRLTFALVSLDGSIQIAQHLFVNKPVEMEEIVQAQEFAHARQILPELIAEHQYVSKIARMEGGV